MWCVIFFYFRAVRKEAMWADTGEEVTFHPTLRGVTFNGKQTHKS